MSLFELAAKILKGNVKGVIINPETFHGWIYGDNWYIEF